MLGVYEQMNGEKVLATELLRITTDFGFLIVVGRRSYVERGGN